MKERHKTALLLFLTFLKIGAFTFGGGYAMIPLIQKEIVTKRKWLGDGDILDIIAIAESTPGPIAVNSATFVGYKTCGFIGAAAATFGVVLPSFLIIYLISFVLRQFESMEAVKYAFNGIRAGVLALVIGAMFSMYKQAPKDLASIIIMFASFLAVAFFNINVLMVIIVCAAVGILLSLLTKRKEDSDDLH